MTQSASERTVALILAAGVGRRLGGHEVKPLLPLPGLPADQGTFLDRHVSLLQKNGIEIAVVVPSGDMARYRRFEERGVRVIANPESALTSGSTMSVRVGLDALACAAALDRRDLLIMDCDIVYEEAVLRRILAEQSRSCILVQPASYEDDEQVHVYGAGDAPKLIGKGLNSAIAAGLTDLGESVGIIRIAASDSALLHDLARWLVGTPPDGSAFGFSKRLSEHEEIWQYFCVLGKLMAAVLPEGLAFAECDTESDYQHLVGQVLPLIRAHEAASAEDCETGRLVASD